MLREQKHSRNKLAQAVRNYVALRSADGEYSTTIECVNRDGEPVVAFVQINIVASPK